MKERVRIFLNDFKAKMSVFQILFRDGRNKNTQTLSLLEIIPSDRRLILENLNFEDYSEGPLDDNLYGIASMWVFGKLHKSQEIYIKISMGYEGERVICISFHIAEHPMKYPLKS